MFAAFSPSASVVGINSCQFPYVFCYQLHPSLLRSANLFSRNNNFSCDNRRSTFNNSFHMPTESLASHNFCNTVNSRYLSDILISDLILQSFSTYHSVHSHFSCFQPGDINDSHSPASCSMTHCSSHKFCRPFLSFVKI